MLSLLIGFLTLSNAEAGITDWKIRPAVKPILSGSVFNDGTNRQFALRGGGALGVSYKQKKSGLKLKGLTRAQYVQTWAPSVSGSETRVGTFIGPWYRVAGLNFGVDYVMDNYENEYVNLGRQQSINPTIGAVADIRVASISFQAGPSYFIGDGSRESVNWDTASFSGLGDEFFWAARARVGVGPFGVGFGVTKRYTAYGEEFVGGVGLAL